MRERERKREGGQGGEGGGGRRKRGKETYQSVLKHECVRGAQAAEENILVWRGKGKGGLAEEGDVKWVSKEFGEP